MKRHLFARALVLLSLLTAAVGCGLGEFDEPIGTTLGTAEAPSEEGLTVIVEGADTYARDGGYAANNYGGEKSLAVKKASTGYNRIAFMKFDLAQVQSDVVSVKLRMFGRYATTGGSLSVTVYSVDETGWQENGLTWKNRPTLAAAIAATKIAAARSAWYEWDVTSYVQSVLAENPDATTVSLALSTDQTTTGVGQFASREDATNAPRLLVDNPAPSPAPTSPTGTTTPTGPTTPTGTTDPSGPFPSPAKDPAGFTALNKSSDTQVIYVSSSMGDDKNDGLSEGKPVKSAAVGMAKLRRGMPDWLLFKRGDTWQGGLGNWDRSGRSATEPIVVSAYGTGPRPLFLCGDGNGIQTWGSNNAAMIQEHVWFIGLHFYANSRNPADPSFKAQTSASSGNGVSWLRGTSDVLIEDCVMRFFAVAVVFQDYDNTGVSGVRLRRNHFLDSYNIAPTHSQGIYIEGTKSILIEENIFDHNGWNESVAGAEQTMFNHNAYIQNGCKNTVAKNNIFLRGSSHGIQLRPGGVANGNFFAYNAISLLVGGGNEPEVGGVDGEANDNVILLGTDIDSSPRAWGFGLENIHTATVSNNIVANADSQNPDGTSIPMNISGVTYSNNIVYNWPKGKNTSGSHPDPSRSPATYDAALGGPGTFEHFVQGLRAQSQQTWRTEYMAQTINAYIRAGF